jgi:hypothetical protein
MFYGCENAYNASPSNPAIACVEFTNRTDIAKKQNYINNVQKYEDEANFYGTFFMALVEIPLMWLFFKMS